LQNGCHIDLQKKNEKYDFIRNKKKPSKMKGHFPKWESNNYTDGLSILFVEIAPVTLPF
jgi:hypothetical protein